MAKDFAVEDKKIEEGAPVCEVCGSLLIKESNEWVCPHCQGEIDFMGEDEDE